MSLFLVVPKTLSCQERFAFVSVVMSYCPGVPFEGHSCPITKPKHFPTFLELKRLILRPSNMQRNLTFVRSCWATILGIKYSAVLPCDQIQHPECFRRLVSNGFSYFGLVSCHRITVLKPWTLSDSSTENPTSRLNQDRRNSRMHSHDSLLFQHLAGSKWFSRSWRVDHFRTSFPQGIWQHCEHGEQTDILTSSLPPLGLCLKIVGIL